MKDDDMRLYWLWLCSLPDINPGTIDKLMGYFKDIRNIFMMTEGQLLKIKGIRQKTRETLLYKQWKNKAYLQKRMDLMKASGILFIYRGEENFPKRLECMEDAPYGLFYSGKLPQGSRPSIAIVGARGASSYGLAAAQYFADALASAGICIISGMASGVDGAAHKGALKNGNPTYGVLGCGPDICYPRENFSLYMDIKGNGGIISEYAPKVLPKPWHFPLRNRIISGLSDGIFVIEARKRSGSLITAGIGLEQGKSVYALPGSFNSPLSEGCHQLIQDGAQLVYTPLDILSDYKIAVKLNEKTKVGLDNSEELVYANLCLYPRGVEEIVHLSGLPLTNVLSALLSLELKGKAVQTGKNYYVIRM